MDLKELENGVNPQRHWYYQSKKLPLFRFFKKMIKNSKEPFSIIDFGSGSGFFAYELLQAFPEQITEVYLIDLNYTLEEIEATKDQQVKKLRFLPEGINHALIMLMDVLEHIEDDYAIMEDITSKLGKDIHFFVTVPAFKHLWSSHDVFLGHYRRYTLNTLSKLLKERSCTITGTYYFFGMIYPLVRLIRKFRQPKDGEMPQSSDMTPLSSFSNGMLKGVHRLELGFSKLNRLAGVSCVAEGKIH